MGRKENLITQINVARSAQGLSIDQIVDLAKPLWKKKVPELEQIWKDVWASTPEGKKRLAVPKFLVVSKTTGAIKEVSANTKKSAWGKFCSLYFGALKPARSDYEIKEAE